MSEAENVPDAAEVPTEEPDDQSSPVAAEEEPSPAPAEPEEKPPLDEAPATEEVSCLY